ncbi:MAG TPA: hypothetical protein VJX16_06405 [Terriglobales bacterium]|nr:hypothetical protein [Terriglobales bacterium]
MADDLKDVLRTLGLSSNLPDLLTNVLVVLKLQQMNIELLWEAYTAGKPHEEGLILVRESNCRLAKSMEQMVNALLDTNPGAGAHPE